MLAVFAVSNAQNTTPAPAPELLQVKEISYDFGQIPQGKPVYHLFEVLNTSNEAIKIDNVQTSCGCTTPEWSRDAIAAGASTTIKVGYNAANEGHFEKYITITYNQTTTKQVKIMGNVWKAPQGSAPSNTSIQILKQNNN